MKFHTRYFLLISSISLLLFCFLTPAKAKSKSLEEIAPQERSSIVTLHPINSLGQQFSTGSGVIIGKNLVITNIHVIKGAAQLTATFQDNHVVFSPGVVGIDKAHDLALISLDTGNSPVISLASESSLHVGDKVAALGSPQGLTNTVTFGNVSNLDVVVDGFPHIQTQTPISSGSSGGALVDQQGRLVGINRAVLLPPPPSQTGGEQTAAENLNFAVPVRFVRDILLHSPEPYQPWSIEAIKIDPKAGLPTLSITNNPLGDLGSFSIDVAPLPDVVKNDGITIESLKQAIKDRLDAAKIITVSDGSSPQNHADLLLTVSPVKMPFGIAYTLLLTLNEDTIITRTTLRQAPIHSWVGFKSGVCPDAKFKVQLTEETSAITDYFIQEYKDANPQSFPAIPATAVKP